jgi:hypothetical protein
VPLTEEEPARFRRESMEDKDRFEQLTGQKVTGFRAPRFSLTPASLWALDHLAEIGFFYSSSIMPTNISLYGFPDAPRAPFTWPNGMIEVPLPVTDVGPLILPYLGGIYLYATPWMLTRRWLAKADKDELLWTYAHPYDFDRQEKFTRMADTPYWVSLVLWLARRNAERKLRKVLGSGVGSPLGERVKALTSLGTYS